MPAVLIIDDERAICSSLGFALEDQYTVYTGLSAAEGLLLLKQHRIDCVLLDLRIGQEDGILLIPEIKKIHPGCVVIMMTAHGSIESSVEAMRSGAYHYLTKPLNLEEVRILIDKALEFQYLQSQVQALAKSVRKDENYSGIIGKSRAMQSLFHLIDRVKNIDSNVLICGESGTGKELVARAIYLGGKRKDKPFHVVNCAAIPENLLESELFGFEKGAFTGAYQRKEGLFASSHEGTIFLDEIGEMPLSLQSKILRAIQEKEITPLGSGEQRKIDVRLIAATNRQLSEDIRSGRFREDLYYRINVIPIHTPPLRDRLEDVPLLIEHFLAHHAARMEKPRLELSHEAKKILYGYTYPGNVRELGNIIEYAVAMCEGRVIGAADLLHNILPKDRMAGRKTAGPAGRGLLSIPEGIPLAEAERLVILNTLDLCGGHRKKTAEVLAVSERSLRDKLKIYLGH